MYRRDRVLNNLEILEGEAFRGTLGESAPGNTKHATTRDDGDHRILVVASEGCLLMVCRWWGGSARQSSLVARYADVVVSPKILPQNRFWGHL